MMALFPAYALDSVEDVDESTSGEECAIPAALETQLLASDEERPAKCARLGSPAHRPRPASDEECARVASPANQDFYLDTKIDYGNLRVSTLYYPGRPEYRAQDAACALGRRGAGAGRAGGRAARRYWQAGAAGAAEAGGEVAARRAALRGLLAAAPQDEDLWLQYIQFQEEWGAEGAALEAALAAVAAGADTARVRAALHRARRRALAPAALCAALRGDIAAESRPRVRRELWARLVEAVRVEEAHAVTEAALTHLAADPHSYPQLLYVYGCVVRAAGLWEQLVQLVELAAAMNYPPSAAFPLAASAAAAASERASAAALRLEEAACASRLPLSAVWARVERLRAGAHWRAAGAGADADPQRAPAPAAAAALLRPARGAAAAAALCVALLRLGKVPLLPRSERAAAAGGAEGAAGEAATAETLAALLRAARRLPPAHAARPAAPAAARRALAPLLDPPHYFSDAAGYLSWINALWEACCGWTEGPRRLALVCWRLRWLHALALLAESGEARRLRGEARLVLKRHAHRAPLAFAHFARIEACASGAAAGRRAAARALGAALADCAAPHEHALHAARVCAELCPRACAAPGAALCCAVLRRACPDAALDAAPDPRLLHEARAACAERCEALEREFENRTYRHEEDEEEEEVCAAMLPGAGEWAAARVALASPAERAPLLARLLAARDAYRGGAARARQYGEQWGVALVESACGAERLAAARALLPLYPRNALLALVCGGAPLWAGGAGGAGEQGASAALALAVPRLLRAPLEQCAAGEAARLAAACARLARRGGGALLATLRLEAAARGGGAAPRAALLAALAAHADHKWVYVRGAAWCGGEAEALCDALLERGLRVHALLDELPSALGDVTATTDTDEHDTNSSILE